MESSESKVESNSEDSAVYEHVVGLPPGQVQVRPYTAEWQRLFRQEAAQLRAYIGNYVLDIQHIGSTSIPYMPAKPIIDISIAVANFEEAAVCVPLMEQLDYEFRGEHGIPRRHYFVKGNPRMYHVHMVELDSDDWRGNLLFRDYLISQPATARAYASLKTELAQQHPTDREAYQAGKDAFIKQVLRMAAAGG